MPTLILFCFGLYLWPIFICFFCYDSCQHNYCASTMNTFESEYPFGDFLEDSKFYELRMFLHSHFQKKNAVNNMDESNILMHALIF